MGRLIPWPKWRWLRIHTTTPQKASLIAQAMAECCALNKPWYGFKVLSQKHIRIRGCGLLVLVKNHDGDWDGLRYQIVIGQIEKVALEAAENAQA